MSSSFVNVFLVWEVQESYAHLCWGQRMDREKKVPILVKPLMKVIFSAACSGLKL